MVVAILTRRAEALGAGLLVTTHDPLIAAHFAIRWQMTDGRPLLPEG
jgi:ABC-type lipoprotein export system ATPase subunit